jgi:N utilization substance protein B
MVNRRYLRTKVMQAIFAHTLNEKENITSGEKKLVNSIEGCYKLFLYFFSIFPELKRYRLNKFEDLKNKINPTKEDLFPNTKFVDNLVIAQIEDNETLKKLWIDHKVVFPEVHKDRIVQLYYDMEKMPEFEKYMQHEERSYQEDKEIILDIITNCFVEHKQLHWLFGEMNVHWFDDYNEALIMVYQNIVTFKESKITDNKISSLLKNSEDKDFYIDLYRKTLLHSSEFETMIESKLQNWETERIMIMDMILMKMALCELTECPTIPVKVIINEYIELAKTYSSAKSGIFINGLLDKLIIQLKEDGRLYKIGRGLIDN